MSSLAMSLLKTTAQAVLLFGFVGLATVPAALAQPAPQPHWQGQQAPDGWQRHHGGERNMRMRGGRGNTSLIALACHERGAERLEISFVRMSHRLDLTEEQKPLFDALKTTALTQQTNFSDTCKAAAGERAPGERPDMVARMKAGLTVDSARVAALTAIMPEFESFYASLSDRQKGQLMQRRQRGHMGMAPGSHGDRKGSETRDVAPKAAPEKAPKTM